MNLLALGVTVLLGLAGCQTLDAARSAASGAIGTGATFSIYGYEGRWAGPVTPTDATCGSTVQGLMTIGHDGFSFDPFQGTILINGTLSDQGVLDGSYSRLAGNAGSNLGLPGSSPRQHNTNKPTATRQTLSITFHGTATTANNNQITGTLTSGHCAWGVTLHPA